MRNRWKFSVTHGNNVFSSVLAMGDRSSDVPVPHFKPTPILLPIPAFRADTDTFLSIENHQ